MPWFPWADQHTALFYAIVVVAVLLGMWISATVWECRLRPRRRFRR